MNIDLEWENFLSGNITNTTNTTNTTNNILETEYDNNNIDYNNDIVINNKMNVNNIEVPKSSELYISTKTKIAYLNYDIDIYKLFWLIPITDYNLQSEGIIKKQIKLSCTTDEDLKNLENNLQNIEYYKEIILKKIDNTNLRNDLKVIKKISIGLSKKDIITNQTKEKSAFYNCFVIVLRLFINNCYKEFHIKIFNTGKIEIPGIKEDNQIHNIIEYVCNLLNKITDNNYKIDTNSIHNVLINSNFNCGYYIEREQLYNILIKKYNVNCSYDPCSYPGIQCLYYINTETGIVKVSYMIFRTGSVLIVGKCDEKILYEIYNFIKDILYNEYSNVNMKYIIEDKKNKKSKSHRKKYIYF